MGYAHVFRKVCRPLTRTDILLGDGMGLCGRKWAHASAADLCLWNYRTCLTFLGVCHSV